jgi:alpha-glucosidase
VRAGAILPLADEAGASAHTGALAADTLTLRVYPDAAASEYALYEDDGRTTAYRTGARAWTRIACRPTARGVTVEVGATEGTYDGMAPERELLLEVLLDEAPAAVRVDGEACAGWFWDPATRLARVALPAADVRRHRRVEIL